MLIIYLRQVEKNLRRGFFKPNEILDLLGFLKQGKACLYAPDQDYGYKSSIFVEFFGHKALTVKFPYIAAKKADCDVYLFSLEKRDSKYEVNLDRVILKGHKMEDDLREINLRIEEKIKKNPENYLWSHRRFKEND